MSESSSAFTLLASMLEDRLSPGARDWFASAAGELRGEPKAGRFGALLSSASRHARDREALSPTPAERDEAARALSGWNPERWTLLETLRVALVLARAERGPLEAFVEDVTESFRYADEGEQRALYRSLAFLPEHDAFVRRAAEGCRTNMRSVFEAVALDTPLPARWFDDIAWRQAVIKCVFIEAPLWRLWGLDGRLSEELARMALDLVDERRSARRVVQPELWACLGTHGGARGLRAIEEELSPANSHTLGRRAAALALARAGETERLDALLSSERDDAVRETLREARRSEPTSASFRAVRPDED